MIEFQANGRPISSVGIQSQLELGSVGLIPAIKKLLGKGLPQETRQQLADAVPQFAQGLEEAGLAVPKHLSTILTPDAVEIVDEFIEGDDVHKMIEGGTGIKAWASIVRALCDLNTGDNRSAVMVDAKPANWIVNGHTWFIDFFPPSLRGKDGQITPWVPEVYKRSRNLFNFNYGDTRGQVTKLLAGARLTYPERYEELKEIALGIAGVCLPRVIATYIKDQVTQVFPDMNLFYSVGGEARLKELLYE